jgi:formate hydrogenlyase subunit 3/multisubunit Na+/H+ antiporter MnhD subunit
MTGLVFIIIAAILAILLIPFAPTRQKGNIAISAIVLSAIVSSIQSFQVLFGATINLYLYGGLIFGDIPVRVDALSAWFILIMNFTSVTAVIYGVQYLRAYKDDASKLSMHYVCFVLNHFAMLSIYVVQNSLAFLCFWEIMAVTAFVMVIFDSHKMETLKAGINYLIQSHVSILFLMLGFIWVNFKTGSFDFWLIRQYATSVQPALGFLLYMLFFIGFSIKAGFVPFHTWLPYAHPAAPSHVSGLMSGVIIKLGIYGILRMLLLIPANYVLIGTVILIISVMSGIYGVMLAILQHNLKRLLAYHSIENIGIIGIGIGLGAIGKGMGNHYLEFAGFAGALLHVLNHSLFKSLLFYAAGVVYQATHILNVEKLGGLIKRLPHTSFLFLLASVSICGLPPFNGFVSEFLIYTGLFNAIHPDNQVGYSVMIILSIFGLVLIGGLALFCFTKAFGVAFLGEARTPYPHDLKEANPKMIIPGYAVALLIVSIGIFPAVFVHGVSKVVSLFSGMPLELEPLSYFLTTMRKVGIASCAIIVFVVVLYYIKKKVTKRTVAHYEPTWGCGYLVSSPKIQYTSGSFSRTYRNLIKPLLKVQKHEKRITTVVPGHAAVENHVLDKVEYILIDIPMRHLKSFIGRFTFLQNGSVQFYILYGVVFIFIAITIPFLIRATYSIIDLFKQL